MDPENAQVPDRLDNEGFVGSNDNSSGVEEDDLDKEVETPDKPEYVQWTTVQCKRTRKGSLQNKKSLTAEQNQTVKVAAEGLTKEQQQQILRRQEKVHPRRGSSVSSRGEGPSKPKGKGIDPREWGNVDIDPESLDVNAQLAALKTFKAQLKAQKRSQGKKSQRKEKSQSRNKNYERSEHATAKSTRRPKTYSGRPMESQPAAQIAPKSYLGAALRHAEGLGNHPSPLRALAPAPLVLTHRSPRLVPQLANPPRIRVTMNQVGPSQDEATEGVNDDVIITMVDTNAVEGHRHRRGLPSSPSLPRSTMVPQT